MTDFRTFVVPECRKKREIVDKCPVFDNRRTVSEPCIWQIRHFNLCFDSIARQKWFCQSVQTNIEYRIRQNLFVRPIKYNRLKGPAMVDRKSTRLNSSHVKISYAVFCLKKKKRNNERGK